MCGWLELGVPELLLERLPSAVAVARAAVAVEADIVGNCLAVLFAVFHDLSTDVLLRVVLFGLFVPLIFFGGPPVAVVADEVVSAAVAVSFDES